MMENLFIDELELMIAGGLIIIVFLIVLIPRTLTEKQNKQTPHEEDELAVEELSQDTEKQQPPQTNTPKRTPEPEPATEQERLELTRKKLAEREKRMKDEKISELKQKENLIGRKKDENETLTYAPPPHNQTTPLTEQLEKDKQKIQELITKAEQRFEQGELEEKNFKSIISDYQKQIIDLDIKIKKQGGKPPN